MIIELYHSLLSLETGLLAIATAIFFIFFQLVYASFSLAEFYLILRQKQFKIFFTLQFVVIVMTLLSATSLSISHNFIFYDLRSNVVFSNPYWISVLLAILASSMFLFIYLVILLFNLINPSNMAELIYSNIKTEDIRKFILNKYGMYEPSSFFLPRIFINDQKEQNEEEIKLKREEAETSFEQLKSDIKSYMDSPLNPMLELGQKYLINSNLTAFASLLEYYCHISEDFVTSFNQVENALQWNPYIKLIDNYIEHLLLQFDSFKEIIRKQGIYSSEITVVEILKRISLGLIEYNQNDSVSLIIRYLKQIAKDFTTISPEVVKSVINTISDVGESVLQDNAAKSDNRLTDEIFRALGSIGENIVLLSQVKKETYMWDDDYETEFDVVMNRLLGFNGIYKENASTAYPLIYFDALDVVILQLLNRYQEDKKINDTIFSLFYEYFSFGEQAIYGKNKAGVDLALTRLVQIHEKFIECNYEEFAKSTIREIVRFGALIAIHKDELIGKGFIYEDLLDYVVEKIYQNQYVFHEVISNELHECSIKLAFDSGKNNHDVVWDYIVRLGMRLKTNFGFMFDSETGELYADDDPRRT